MTEDKTKQNVPPTSDRAQELDESQLAQASGGSIDAQKEAARQKFAAAQEAAWAEFNLGIVSSAAASASAVGGSAGAAAGARKGS